LPKTRFLGLVLGLHLALAPSFAGEARLQRSAPIELLGNAFRLGDLQSLRRLLGSDEKVYMASANLGFDAGYYSADQVCLLIRGVLRDRTTLKFDFLSGPANPSQDSPSVAVARWIYRRGNSRETTVRLSFMLVRRDGGWVLKEVRDLP